MSLPGSTPLQGGKEQDGALPRLAEPFQPTPSPKSDTTPRAASGADVTHEDQDNGKKQKKRGLFGFGKKKVDEPVKSPSSLSDLPSPNLSTTAVKDVPIRSTATSPVHTEHSIPIMPSSPNRGLSSSPRLSSPAGSQIFERDVQESTVLIPNSPAIPSHITTENYIPPVLDASSEAITDDHLSPDTVEIITHTGHQPAAVTVTGISDQASSSWADDLASFAADKEDSASNYGSFDTTDVRRLSFISFADVVQAEQAGHAGHAGSRDSVHLAGLTSLASMGVNRSPSPIRSPISSAGGPGTSPPTSKSGSVKGLELSPSRKPLGSPTLSQHAPGTTGIPPPASGELNIETMSQALRRTGSTDLSAVRSLPTSPVEGPSR